MEIAVEFGLFLACQFALASQLRPTRSGAVSRSPKRIDTKYSAAPRDSSVSPTWMTRARIAASVLGDSYQSDR